MRRLTHRLSQTTVAEQAGISQELLSQIERNEREFSSVLIQKIALTIDGLTGQSPNNKVLERITHITSQVPFPSDNGRLFYWQGHVEGEKCVFVSDDGDKVEIWEDTSKESEAAIQDGVSLFRFGFRVDSKTENRGMTKIFLLKRFPEPEELIEDFEDVPVAARLLLNYLASFISRWCSTKGVQKSE